MKKQKCCYEILTKIILVGINKTLEILESKQWKR